MTGTAKRGNCRYCGGRYSLTKAGRVRRHKIRGKQAVCGGSGGMPR